MAKKSLFVAALIVIMGAAISLVRDRSRQSVGRSPGFVKTSGSHFVVDGRPFRFIGANLPNVSGQLESAAQAGLKVVRIWATGEGGAPEHANPASPPPSYPYRWTPTSWNEEAFIQLDRILAEAAHHNVRAQICLANWWRDTGGVTQYLRWAGVEGGDDDKYPHGINFERAMLFYTNEETRRLYREHLEKLATRRNTVTGILYRDDPMIFGWELMNEAQAVTGRWAERRKWVAEMSAYLKSLDPNHLIAPGDWGYRSAAERREWVVDHQLPYIDYCEVHNYPMDDRDSFVDSPAAMREFIDNRAAAAFEVGKPLVLGEFGIEATGYNGVSRNEWFRSFFEFNTRAGVAGAMFWILTPDVNRRYSVTFTERDQGVWQEISRGAWLMNTYRWAGAPPRLTDGKRWLVPRQVATGIPGTPDILSAETNPKKILNEDKSILYRFKPEMTVRGQFEKLGGGQNYIWGAGVGFFDYVVPEREDRRRVSEIVVRAHLQPVAPTDIQVKDIKTRVTLFINGVDCGSRLIAGEDPKEPLNQEWRVKDFWLRLSAMRGLPLRFRFAVLSESDWLYGVNISTWPEGYEAGQSAPVEVEIRRQ